ncbi:TetR/AcrR family transcriptional regulator [Chitinasiproducens palmae]|uniref:DNA-binding transcriptional regulator, AcrR family n=1 Tax=Chitinasiproducens palmae TaxID=1770053 RepID=A0A1H2PLN8_9BURK|nr:TetR/AcrR family transcriptional regulator [Chitinasiproducens palmae]SDV47327.1 DNA-binding transcriptional regulator, AcrR family [Chitinasiproducens palmae]
MDDLKRKTPNQSRARKTVETLLETTAQILAQEGSGRLTTNYLAEKAGYSIGTVYQYFPNREAIVMALIERQREHVQRRISEIRAMSADATAEQKIRGIIRVLHASFDLHRLPQPRLVQALVQLALVHGLPSPSDAAAHAIIEIWQTERRGALNESEAFVLSAGLLEVLRRATLQGFPLLGSDQFEQAVVRLVMGFLNAAVDDTSRAA